MFLDVVKLWMKTEAVQVGPAPNGKSATESFHSSPAVAACHTQHFHSIPKAVESTDSVLEWRE